MSCMPTPSSQLSSIDITTDDVYDQLSTLVTSKAYGCDSISPHLLKLCAGSIVDPVSALFNMSLASSVLPQEWKVHQITPIFKSGDPHCVENYRPISLLCILSKVLESIMYSKIIDFVQDTLCQHQFGFLRNHSSVSQLLITFSNIISNCESDLPTDQVFLISERLLTLSPTPSSSSSFGVLASKDHYGVGSETTCLIVSTLFSWMAFHHLSYLSGQEYLKVVYLAPFSSWSL